MRIHGISEDWFLMWNDDKRAMIDTMKRNVEADIDAGYNERGFTVVKAKEALDRYIRRYEDDVESFKRMTEKDVQRWCFYDLVKRGVVEL